MKNDLGCMHNFLRGCKAYREDSSTNTRELLFEIK